MHIQSLIDKLKESNELADQVKKFTLIVNEKSETQGALFFIPLGSKEFKVLIPSPFHMDVIGTDNNNPSLAKILSHKEALLLK